MARLRVGITGSFQASCRLAASASRIPDFAAQWLARRFPLATLRPPLHGAQRMTRGLIDSPFLISIKLSLTISCQQHCRTKRLGNTYCLGSLT
jgi:hypothetical protein